jgi:hypothetical protein
VKGRDDSMSFRNLEEKLRAAGNIVEMLDVLGPYL